MNHRIVYYVATSIDGFICGENEDISGFVADGDGVQQYLADLQNYKTVIMGRNTYEFGYQYGMHPGEAPYPHMEHYIFSNELRLKTSASNVHVCPIDLNEIEKIKTNATTDIYLCGGGQFAGWLLDNGLIDVLKLKVNPLFLGKGIRIFGDSSRSHQLELTESASYSDGLVINSYLIRYL